MIPLKGACALFLCVAVSADVLNPHPLSEDFIVLINKKQSMWKAGRNFPLQSTIKDLKTLMGALDDEHLTTLAFKIHKPELIEALPENFDPRDEWPNCPTLNEIRDQGSCGSCWAFGAAEAMTDRVCIYSNGTQHFHFSAEDLLSCCQVCGHGCHGGKSSIAWMYWKHYGIVSGGNYNSSQGCSPYTIPPGGHHGKRDRNHSSHHKPTPKCKKMCRDGYDIPYKNDKRYGKSIYHIRSEEKHIMAEIYKHGPVEASFKVYEDFAYYKTGVYRHIVGEALGKHAIKIIGWGVEDGIKYWLIANSWGTNWGDKGFFKILRGENHCNIESSIVAGEPLLF